MLQPIKFHPAGYQPRKLWRGKKKLALRLWFYPLSSSWPHSWWWPGASPDFERAIGLHVQGGNALHVWRDGAFNFIYFTQEAKHRVPVLRGWWAWKFAPYFDSGEDRGLGMFTSLQSLKHGRLRSLILSHTAEDKRMLLWCRLLQPVEHWQFWDRRGIVTLVVSKFFCYDILCERSLIFTPSCNFHGQGACSQGKSWVSKFCHPIFVPFFVRYWAHKALRECHTLEIEVCWSHILTPLATYMHLSQTHFLCAHLAGWSAL